MQTKFTSLLSDYAKTVSRLEEVLRMPKDDIVRDSAIKRFEIVFDMAWKALKLYLEEKHNVQCVSPKTCFREAYNKRLIVEYDNFWVKLADLRNETIHTYNEKIAEKVYGQLSNALEYFKQLLADIKK